VSALAVTSCGSPSAEPHAARHGVGAAGRRIDGHRSGRLWRLTVVDGVALPSWP